MKLNRNVGSTERVFRLGAGIAAGAAALLLPELRGLRIPLAIAGVTALVTGVSRYCPINHALGIDNYTRSLERKRARRELMPTPGLSQL